MFDSCLLLGSDGNVVYSGPQRLAQSYMAFLGFYIPPNENLADFLLDVTSGKQDSSNGSNRSMARLYEAVIFLHAMEWSSKGVVGVGACLGSDSCR